MSLSKGARRAVRIGVLVGIATGVAVKRWLTTGEPMPHAQVWERTLLARGRAEADAGRLMERIQTCYSALAAERPRLASRILDLHMMAVLLPGLALYRTMLEEYGSTDAALEETEALFVASFGRLAGVMGLLNELPGGFELFRGITRRTLKIGFPHGGWEISPVEDSERCIAFDYTRCLYLEMLVAYDAPELTPLFCKMDDLLYQALPQAITWHRSQTMAEGGSHCDFRWCWDETLAASQARG